MPAITCANCHNQVPDGAAFCTSCGRPVATRPLRPTPATAAEKPIYRKRWFQILAFFVVVGALGNLLPSPPESAPSPAAAPQPEPVVATAAHATASEPPAAPAASPVPEGSDAQRQQVGADIRAYLRDQDIPAFVVPTERTLRVRYRNAQIEYAPDTFLRQQGAQGLKRIHDAGFTTLVIEANDATGSTQQREFSVADLVAEREPTGNEPRAEIVRTRIVPFTMANGRTAQMVLADWKNVGTAPVRVVHADIIAYDDTGRALESGAKGTTIFHADDSEPVGPGRTYREPGGMGWLLLPIHGKAARAEVTITAVE